MQEGNGNLLSERCEREGERAIFLRVQLLIPEFVHYVGHYLETMKSAKDFVYALLPSTLFGARYHLV